MVHYSFGPGFLAGWFLTGAFGRRRDFAWDARRALARCGVWPEVEGAGSIPAQGSFVIASNHYQRPGMGAWWTAMAISAAVAERRPDVRIRWMHTNRFGGYRIAGLIPVPESVMAPLLRWASDRYGFLLVVRDDAALRAPMLRQARRALHADGDAVGIMPEAGNAHPDGRLGAAKPGAGPAIAWLLAGSVPLVPAGVFEADGHLVVRFGPPVSLARHACSDALTDVVMHEIRDLLPARLAGAYEEALR